MNLEPEKLLAPQWSHTTSLQGRISLETGLEEVTRSDIRAAAAGAVDEAAVGSEADGLWGVARTDAGAEVEAETGAGIFHSGVLDDKDGGGR